MEQNKTDIQDYVSPALEIYVVTATKFVCSSPNGSSESMGNGSTDGWFN